MPRLSIRTAILVVLALGAGTSLNAYGQGDPRAEIERANAALAAAFEKQDAAAAAAMYTETGQIFPPNSDALEGRAAIEQFWKATLAQGIARVELKTVEVESLGDSVVETGRATLYSDGGTIIDRAKYLVVWKKVGGQWKLHRDIWNSSQAASGN
jgi:uncharacterized protein (TIGR02246 family)